MDLPPQLWFYTKDGKVLKNKEEFYNYLKNCSEELFFYHREHFYNWLIHCFGDCRTAFIVKCVKDFNKIKQKLNL